MARILVADDEAGIRSFLTDALALAGHEVIETSDGLEAIRVLMAEPFDLVITDLMMPGADGLAVLRTARSLRPQVQVILLTAQSSRELASQARNEGASDFLAKPLSGPAELRVAVERVLACKPPGLVAPGS
ncbi:MAG: response regulator [Myxococcota bacterium]